MNIELKQGEAVVSVQHMADKEHATLILKWLNEEGDYVCCEGYCDWETGLWNLFCLLGEQNFIPRIFDRDKNADRLKRVKWGKIEKF